eukprot:Colp12_sorted_trinity150504_noHs@14222
MAEDILADPDAVPKSKKHRFRDNVPDSCRGEVWCILTGGRRWMDMSPELYANASEQVFGDKVPLSPTPPSFGSRIGLPVGEGMLGLTDFGIDAARRILCTLAFAHSTTDYAPHLPLFALACLHYMGEVETYYCLHSLITCPTVFFPRSRSDASVSCLTFVSFVQHHCKKIYAHITKVCPTEEGRPHPLVFDKFFDWMSYNIPARLLIRYFDCLLAEGPKINYRFALAYMMTYEEKILHARSEADLLELLFTETRNLDVESFFKRAFAISLSRNECFAMHSAFQKRKVRHEHDQFPAETYYRPLPHMNKEDRSRILDDVQLEHMWKWMPARYRNGALAKVFDTNTDGYSLNTLYKRCGETKPLVLVIKATTGEVFGAYVGSSFEERRQHEHEYYGNGEMFLFSLSPDTKRYNWVGKRQTSATVPQFFMLAGNRHCVLGGGDMPAIWLDEDFNNCSTYKCTTFNNAPFVEAQDHSFSCSAIEVYSITGEVNEDAESEHDDD